MIKFHNWLVYELTIPHPGPPAEEGQPPRVVRLIDACDKGHITSHADEANWAIKC